MRRRLSAALLALVASLAIAAPVLADTVPDPGNFRDSGTADYFSAFSSECGQSTCTDTNVYGHIVHLQGGETITEVCVDQFTYAIRNGRGTFLGGCTTATPDFSADGSSVSWSGTILADSCGRRTCTTEAIDVSVDLATVGSPASYSRTERYQFENCTDTYRVRGESAPAEGTIQVDGSTLQASGEIGSESFQFSSRCR